MNALAPPGWYRDPHGTGSRYWDGQRWSDHLLPEGAPFPPASEAPLHPGRKPLGGGARVAVTVTLVVGLVGIPTLLGDIARWVFLTDETTDGALRRLEIQNAIQLAVLVLLTGLVATRVSYRWFDGLIALVPLCGIFWIFRIAWRVAYLPFRDWPPRADEAATWRQVAHPKTPGGMLYVVD